MALAIGGFDFWGQFVVGDGSPFWGQFVVSLRNWLNWAWTATWTLTRRRWIWIAFWWCCRSVSCRANCRSVAKALLIPINSVALSSTSKARECRKREFYGITTRIVYKKGLVPRMTEIISFKICGIIQSL
jgi:hypothetical protein